MDPLDRELAALLSIEPSPEFRARVRVRIASEPAPAAWLPRWGGVAAGVAVLSVAVALVVGRSQPASRTRRDVAVPVSTSVAPDSVASGFPPALRFGETRSSAQRESGSRTSKHKTTAEVLVAASEVRGVRELEAIVREGRTQFVFPDEDIRAVSPQPVQDIMVAPITIAPLETAAISEVAGTSEGDEP